MHVTFLESKGSLLAFSLVKLKKGNQNLHDKAAESIPNVQNTSCHLTGNGPNHNGKETMPECIYDPITAMGPIPQLR